MKQEKKDGIDTTMLILMGFGSGALLSAMFFLIFGIFIDTDKNETWSINALLSGLMGIGISVIVGLITMLYWRFILSKSGVLFPRLTGFKIIAAIASAVPGAAFTINLAYKFII